MHCQDEYCTKNRQKGGSGGRDRPGEVTKACIYVLALAWTFSACHEIATAYGIRGVWSLNSFRSWPVSWSVQEISEGHPASDRIRSGLG